MTVHKQQKPKRDLHPPPKKKCSHFKAQVKDGMLNRTNTFKIFCLTDYLNRGILCKFCLKKYTKPILNFYEIKSGFDDSTLFFIKNSERNQALANYLDTVMSKTVNSKYKAKVYRTKLQTNFCLNNISLLKIY